MPDCTQTEEREEEKAGRPDRGPRFIRFFRADDPFDEVASFLLPRRSTFQIGRADGRSSSAATPGNIWTYGDALMSGRHAVLADVGAGWQISDLSSKNGTWVNGRRIDKPQLLQHGDIVECGRSFFLLRDEVHEPLGPHIPRGPKLDVLPFYYQIASLYPYFSSDVAVHLCGETGTGKEVIARTLHSLARPSGNFVAINCAAIPASLFESEMFGFRKGAFSGATESQRGAVLAADCGTLFLDEIGELPAALQPKLLRVLELKEVVPVGTSTPVPVDFRLISATLCDLRAMADCGQFRRDLYARLGQPFRVPPLREHKEELGRIVQACLTRILMDARDAARPHLRFHFTLAAARAIVYYDWPYNVREAKQSVNHALVSALSEVPSGSEVCCVDLRHLPAELAAAERGSSIVSSVDGALAGPEAIEPTTQAPSDLHIMEALMEAQGNRSQAARMLGVTERTIYRRLRKLRDDEASLRLRDPGARAKRD